jgi:hypothetical protein
MSSGLFSSPDPKVSKVSKVSTPGVDLGSVGYSTQISGNNDGK